MEKELAQEFVDILRQNNVKSLKLHRLLAEIEIALLKHMKFDHYTKVSFAVALSVSRTTLNEKMKRYGIKF